MSAPLLSGIDHCHLNVENIQEALKWYKQVLGFSVVEELAFWDENGKGPLTLEDSAKTTRLALFEGQGRSKGIAFDYLNGLNIKTVLADHSVTFSLYFKDNSGNSHEITSHDYPHIKAVYGDVKQGSRTRNT